VDEVLLGGTLKARWPMTFLSVINSMGDGSAGSSAAYRLTRRVDNGLRDSVRFAVEDCSWKEAGRGMHKKIRRGT